MTSASKKTGRRLRSMLMLSSWVVVVGSERGEVGGFRKGRERRGGDEVG